ncbi:hypothetical protein [Prosthecobacter sp.]|uniref:hypothetical protein n=1 Tax=Prosthecobacter sp. TaxID=1965333 RepID=UPI003783045A
MTTELPKPPAGPELGAVTGSAFPRRPGLGWKRLLPAPVWEHTSGIRIHGGGLVLLPSGRKVWAENWPECRQLATAVRQQGGTRRRGLMVYALRLLKQNYQIVDEDHEAAPAMMQFASDAFYGKPLASCLKMILEQRKSLNKGPASVEDFYTELVNGGYHFEGKEENRKTILRTALRKNSDFHRLPNGLHGLSQWYERIKKPSGNGNTDDSDDFEPQEEDKTDADLPPLLKDSA